MQSSFPGGSEERSMINMSLARIMYGTDDVHVPYSLNPSLSARSIQSAHDDTQKGASVSTHSSIGGVLRKAWTVLIKD
jgi:hypothetical protein